MAKSAKKSGNKVLGFVFLALVAAGLVLVIVGMCVDVISAKIAVGSNESVNTIKLFDDTWDKSDISTAFLLVSFIVTIVGLAGLAVDGVLRVFLGKDIKILRAVFALVAIVGAILILVAGLVLAGQVKENTDILGAFGVSIKGIEYKVNAAAGVWLGFAGGLVGGICGGLPLLKKFN